MVRKLELTTKNSTKHKRVSNSIKINVKTTPTMLSPSFSLTCTKDCFKNSPLEAVRFLLKCRLICV